MRNRRVYPMLGLFLVSGVMACVGGAAGNADAVLAWEPAEVSFEGASKSTEAPQRSGERANSTVEPALNSTEPALGAQSGGATRGTASSIECAGTYTCGSAGDKKSDSVRLVASGSGCSFEGYVIEPGGKVTLGGNVVGQWSGSFKGTFSVTIGKSTASCTSSATAGTDTGSSSGNGSGSGTKTPTPTPTSTGTVVDAG